MASNSKYYNSAIVCNTNKQTKKNKLVNGMFERK